jgi:hypothetical protein
MTVKGNITQYHSTPIMRCPANTGGPNEAPVLYLELPAHRVAMLRKVRRRELASAHAMEYNSCITTALATRCSPPSTAMR